MKFYSNEYSKYEEYLTRKKWHIHPLYMNDDQKYITGFHADKRIGFHELIINVLFEDYKNHYQARYIELGFFINIISDSEGLSHFSKHCLYAPVHRKYDLDGNKVSEDWVINRTHCTYEVHKWINENNIKRSMTKEDRILFRLRFA